MFKKLEFIEQFIDEKPTENSWRGINAICNGINIFDIFFKEKNTNFGEESYFKIRPSFFPYSFIKENEIVVFEEYNKVYFNKEEVKKAAQILFEKYINLFLK